MCFHLRGLHPTWWTWRGATQVRRWQSWVSHPLFWKGTVPLSFMMRDTTNKKRKKKKEKKEKAGTECPRTSVSFGWLMVADVTRVLSPLIRQRTAIFYQSDLPNSLIRPIPNSTQKILWTSFHHRSGLLQKLHFSTFGKQKKKSQNTP